MEAFLVIFFSMSVACGLRENNDVATTENPKTADHQVEHVSTGQTNVNGESPASTTEQPSKSHSIGTPPVEQPHTVAVPASVSQMNGNNGSPGGQIGVNIPEMAQGNVNNRRPNGVIGSLRVINNFGDTKHS